jgi:hypothetical protein
LSPTVLTVQPPVEERVLLPATSDLQALWTNAAVVEMLAPMGQGASAEPVPAAR